MPAKSGYVPSAAKQRELAHEVKNYNARRAYAIKRDAAAAEYLPQKVSVREIKKTLASGRDLRYEINALKKFTAETAVPVRTKAGTVTTKFQLKDIQSRVERINRERKKEMERAAPSTERGTMGTIRTANLQPKKFTAKKIQPKHWKEYVRMVEKQSAGTYRREQAELYKANYLHAFNQCFTGLPGSEVIRNIVEAMDPDDLIRLYYSDDTFAIGFQYGAEAGVAKLKELMNTFRKEGYDADPYAAGLPEVTENGEDVEDEE